MKKKNKLNRLLNIFFSFIRRFRWIDILGISVFLFILGISFFFFLRKSSYVNIVLRVSESQGFLTWGDKTPTWYLENLKSGTTQNDLLGRPVISIIGSRSFRTSEKNKIFLIDLRLRTTYTPRTKEYIFNGVPVLVGSSQTFNINGIKIMGIVQKVGNTDNNFPKKKLVLKGVIDPIYNDDYASLAANTISDGIDRYLSALLREGLVMKDSDSKVILEVKKVKKMPATRQFIFGNNLVKAPDFDREKVEMELEISVDEIDGAYVFMEENVIKINSTFYLDFMQFWAKFKVTSIEEIK